jgi:hypothetical protein
MLTIVELPEYLRAAEKLLDEEERFAIVTALARTPASGALIIGTGGIRKLRWARPGTGKSGGVRVIYYFHNTGMPLFFLSLFAKGTKPDLSKSERNELAALARYLRSQTAGN